MIKNYILLVFVFLLVFIKVDAQNEELKLWYDEPGKVWTDALPIGNGRLGAMVYDHTENETIPFYQENLWGGQQSDFINVGASFYFKKIW